MNEPDTPKREWHLLEALRAQRRTLEARISLVENLGARDDGEVVANLDEHLVRLIATELAESATNLNREWELAALAERRGDLEAAMSHLARAYVEVHSMMPNQIEDLGDALWQALGELDARLSAADPPAVE